MNIDLKPCPFCGKKPLVIETVFDKYGVNRLKIECCMSFDIWADPILHGSNGEGMRAGRDAAEIWNARAGEQK